MMLKLSSFRNFYLGLIGVGWIFGLSVFYESAYAQAKSSEFSINDCLISNLKGVNSDAAARMVKSACEAKQREHDKAKIEATDAEYGAEVPSSGVSVAGWDYDGDKLIVGVKNDLPREGPSLSYIRLSIGVPKSAESDCSTYQEAAYKVMIPPGETLVVERSLFFPKSTKELCIYVEYARAKMFSWKERLSNKASLGNPRPLSLDPYKWNWFPPAKSTESTNSDITNLLNSTVPPKKSK